MSVRKQLVGLLVAVLLATSGCAQSSVNEPERSSRPDVLAFGPRYAVDSVEDGLLVRALELDGAGPSQLRPPSENASPSEVEIRGYLVDWVIVNGSSRTMRELAVMKDGSLFRAPGQRPAAAFGQVAPPRLGPEPAAERKARESAVASAHAVVRRLSPQFAGVKPTVFNYLVRIRRVDGAISDLWVDPTPDPGRLFYSVELEPLQ